MWWENGLSMFSRHSGSPQAQSWCPAGAWKRFGTLGRPFRASKTGCACTQGVALGYPILGLQPSGPGARCRRGSGRLFLIRMTSPDGREFGGGSRTSASQGGPVPKRGQPNLGVASCVFQMLRPRNAGRVSPHPGADVLPGQGSGA
jgi:hypothetical protein